MWAHADSGLEETNCWLTLPTGIINPVLSFSPKEKKLRSHRILTFPLKGGGGNPPNFSPEVINTMSERLGEEKNKTSPDAFSNAVIEFLLLKEFLFF